MSDDNLREFQELMYRAYVRHMMFLATFPYHLLQAMRRDLASAGDRRTGTGAPILRLASQTKDEQ